MSKTKRGGRNGGRFGREGGRFGRELAAAARESLTTHESGGGLALGELGMAILGREGSGRRGEVGVSLQNTVAVRRIVYYCNSGEKWVA